MVTTSPSSHMNIEEPYCWQALLWCSLLLMVRHRSRPTLLLIYAGSLMGLNRLFLGVIYILIPPPPPIWRWKYVKRTITRKKFETEITNYKGEEKYYRSRKGRINWKGAKTEVNTKKVKRNWSKKARIYAKGQKRLNKNMQWGINIGLSWEEDKTYCFVGGRGGTYMIWTYYIPLLLIDKLISDGRYLTCWP